MLLSCYLVLTAGHVGRTNSVYVFGRGSKRNHEACKMQQYCRMFFCFFFCFVAATTGEGKGRLRRGTGDKRKTSKCYRNSWKKLFVFLLPRTLLRWQWDPSQVLYNGVRSSSAYTSDTHRKVMLQWPFTTHMAPNLQMVCQWVREGSGWKQLLPVSGWENKREMDRQETLGGQINRCPWSSELRGGMMSASLSTTVYHTMSAQWLALMSTVSSAL